jgi:hypothetical protein
VIAVEHFGWIAQHLFAPTKRRGDREPDGESKHRGEHAGVLLRAGHVVKLGGPVAPRGSQLTDAPQSAGLVALADRIELWPIDRLRPYERNPRTHSGAQVDQIAASMVEFGWTNPVLVDEQGGILAGHGCSAASSCIITGL